MAPPQVIQEHLVLLEPQVVTPVHLADTPEHREHPVGSKGRAPMRWPRSNHPNPKC